MYQRIFPFIKILCLLVLFVLMGANNLEAKRSLLIRVVWDKSYELWCTEHKVDPLAYTGKFMNKVKRSLEQEIPNLDVTVNIDGQIWENDGAKDLLKDLATDFPQTSDSLKVLGITDRYNDHNGIAELNGGHCLIDPRPRWYLYNWPEPNIAKHEICHTLGAEDHWNGVRCVMNKSIPYFWKSGAFNLKLCDRCQAAILNGGLKEVSSHHIILRVSEDDLKVLRDPAKWLEKLDKAYEAYAELVGGKPYEGRRICIESVKKYPGGWAVAGNPIKWHQPYVADAFKQINQGDWLFGILHELSHDFDLDYRWVWEAEFFANLKMVYVAEKLGAKIKQGGRWYDYRKAHSPTLANYYAEMAQKADESDLLRDWLRHNDPATDKFLKIKAQIGWEPFKKTFREYNKLTPSQIPKTPQRKFNLFGWLLSTSSGQDLSHQFIQWGFPWIAIDRPNLGLEEYVELLNQLDWDLLVRRKYVGQAGKPLKIEVSVTEKAGGYKKGLGTHANSEIVYNLNGRYQVFQSDVGVDEETGSWGSVVFMVYVDGELKFNSGRMEGLTPLKRVSIPIAGRKELKLLVLDAGDGINSDHADWADAKLIDEKGKVTYLSDLKPKKANQGWGELGRDRSVEGNTLAIGRTLSPKGTILEATVAHKAIRLRDPEGDGIYEGELRGLPVGDYRVTVRAKREETPYSITKTSFASINPLGIIYLSDLVPLSFKQGWGNLEPDRSVGGRTIKIGGKAYKKGLGTHAEAEIVYRLDRLYETFQSTVGLDDEVKRRGSVVFQVWVDGRKVFDSGIMRGGDRAKEVKLSVKGIKELKLVVKAAGDGINYDHADWADAKLIGSH